MSNHIAAKFLTIIYSSIPKETFSGLIPQLEEALRSKLPRYERSAVNQIKVEVVGDVISTTPERAAQELLMVDAEGTWGIKVGNQGVSFSTSKYISYPETIAYLENIFNIIADILKVTHFSQVSLRNLNLFRETAPNHFEDIKYKEYWGRQNFTTLADDFICNGAATRHEYFDRTYLKHVQILSGVVLGGQSYIPQEEWNMWDLRGNIPINDPNSVHLIIDISSTRFEGPANVPKSKVTECKWDTIVSRFHEIHKTLNAVYEDITQDN